MTRMSPHAVAASTVALGAAALLALAAPLSASAHVSLESNTATPGTFDTLTFRVPNESTDGATTNRLTINLPADAGLLASVKFEPVAGWTAELVTTKLATPVVHGDQTTTEAVTQVVWTATPGSELGAGALGVFRLYVGPIPKVGSLKLPIDQGYSDGTTASWNGAPDSEHPAPVLYVTDPPVADHDADSAPNPAVTAHPATAATGGDGSDVVARVLGGAGLVLGAVGLVIALSGRRTGATRPAKAD